MIPKAQTPRSTASVDADEIPALKGRYFFDLETNGFLDAVHTIHSLVMIDMDDGSLLSFADHHGYTPVEEGLALLRDAEEVCGLNIIGYDIPVIRKLFPSYVPKGKITDTLILTRLLFPELREMDFEARALALSRNKEPQLPGQLIGSHSLKAWGIRLGFNKGHFGETADWSTWTREMQVYCEQDVRVTERLYQMLAQKFDLQSEWAQAVSIEMRFASLIALQEAHGFRFDVEEAVRLEGEIRVRKAEAESKLFDLFAPWWITLGEQCPTRAVNRFVESPEGSTTRTIERETGLTYQHTYKNGKTVTRKEKLTVLQEGYFEGIEQDAPYTKVSLRVFNPGSRHHIANRLIALYGWKPAEHTVSGDAKIDDDILSALPYPPAQSLAVYFMLEKRLAQLADGKQAWLKLQRDGRIHGRVNTLGAVTGRCTHSHPPIAGTPSIENAKGVVPYGAEFRALFRADIDHDLMGCDAAGLELRCLAHFMKDGGIYSEIVRNGTKEEGTDIHTTNMRAAGLPSRNAAKTFIYAFLYGAGNQKLGSIIAPNATAESQSKQGVILRRKFLKNTRGLKGLIEGVKSAAALNKWVRGVDGRRVAVRATFAALNSLLQNAGAVAMKLAPVLMYERLISEGFVWGPDFAMVAHVHDEMQISVRPDIAQYVADVANWSITEAGNQLGFLCPLAGEAAIGASWKDTH
jgi:DNA polymerase-1